MNRFTDNQIADIRHRLATGEPARSIAKRYGTNATAMSQAIEKAVQADSKQTIESLNEAVDKKLPKIIAASQDKFEAEIKSVLVRAMEELRRSGQARCPQQDADEFKRDVLDAWSEKWDLEMQKLIGNLTKKKRPIAKKNRPAKKKRAKR